MNNTALTGQRVVCQNSLVIATLEDEIDRIDVKLATASAELAIAERKLKEADRRVGECISDIIFYEWLKENK